MIRLRGTAHGGGAALGIAAVVSEQNGIPILPPFLLAHVSTASMNPRIEPIDVVLLARNSEIATSISLPRVNVAGIAAVDPAESGAGLGVPFVSGIDALLDSAQAEQLVLVDGDRGLVLVDPTSAAVAAYQADRDRIAPRHRFFLDYAHQPATTPAGRQVHVIASVRTMDDVQQSIENGADSLYVPADAAFISAEATDEEQYESLLALADAAAGKAITLGLRFQDTSMAAVLKAAVRAHVTFASALTGSPSLSEIREHLAEAREALLSEEEEFADIRLAGSARVGDAIAAHLPDYLIHRLVVDASDPKILDSEAMTKWIREVSAAANGLLLPIEMLLPSAEPDVIDRALGLGAAGLIVTPDAIQPSKERVRGFELETDALGVD